MIKDNEIIPDYGWITPKTNAHTYLLDSINRVLKNINISQSANILDAGCGGGVYFARTLR